MTETLPMKTKSAIIYILSLLVLCPHHLRAKDIEVPEIRITNPYIDNFLRKQFIPLIKANAKDDRYVATIHQNFSILTIALIVGIPDPDYSWHSTLKTQGDEMAYLEIEGIKFIVVPTNRTKNYIPWHEPTGRFIRFTVKEYSTNETIHATMNTDDNGYYMWDFIEKNNFIEFSKGSGNLQWIRGIRRMKYTPWPARVQTMKYIVPDISDYKGDVGIKPPSRIEYILLPTRLVRLRR